MITIFKKWSKGFTTELWTLPVSRPYNPNGKRMGELMQADLKKIGVNVKLISYDWPTYLEKSKNGEHQLLQLGWTGDNGDPDNFLHVLLGCAAVKAGANRARWCNKKFNNLIEKAKRTTKLSKRVSLYGQAQKIFKEQAPWVTIAHSITHKAFRSNVTGYKIDPLGGDYFYYVDLK
jgi:dipeptide transport system substrate-binding protein